jgi:predicted RNase H-like nuclease (RuvC/YqgF family)
MSDELTEKFFAPCHHQQIFTIEPHGDGQTLYFGRCNHYHGYNLCAVDEVSYNALEILNKPLEQKAELEAENAKLKAIEVRYWEYVELYTRMAEAYSTLKKRVEELEADNERLRQTVTGCRKIFHQYLRKTKQVRLDLLAAEVKIRSLSQQGTKATQ